MSVVQYPEIMTSKDVQMWDNAAFDNGENSETSTNTHHFSWSNTMPVSSIDLSNQSFDSDCAKENVTPSVLTNNAVENTFPKYVSKMGVSEKNSQGNAVLDDRSLDWEIEKIEKEINRLSSKLEELRLEKAKKKAKVTEKRGRIIAAKFMDPPKQALRRSDEQRKSEELVNTSAKLNTPRRGMSLGPSEIYSATKLKQFGCKQAIRRCNEQKKSEETMNNMSGKPKTPRRGMSLGPSEIYSSATKMKQLGSKHETTPVQSSSNRMKRGISLNTSEIYSATTKLKQLGSKNEITPLQPSSSRIRRGISLNPSEIYSDTIKMKQLASKQVLTPIQSSSNRRNSCYWKIQEIDELSVAKQRGKSMTVSPKSRSKTVNRPQIPKLPATTIGVKKLGKIEEGVSSLIQPKKLFDKDGEKSWNCKNPVKSGRVVASRYNQITSGGSSALKELRKRSWSENEEEFKRSDKKRFSLVAESEGVPRIKTDCLTIESPRDSGPAKRVLELAGKKSFFSEDEFVCKDLSFEEEQNTKEYTKIRVHRLINETPRNSGEVKRASQLVGRKPFFADEDEVIPVFSFEEEDVEQNCIENEDVLL